MSNLPERILKEFEMAERSIETGNMGKARVCARRAVTFAIQYKLKEEGIFTRKSDLQSLTTIYLERFNVSDRMKQIIENMHLKAGYRGLESEHYWPHEEVDLLEESRFFIKQLLIEK